MICFLFVYPYYKYATKKIFVHSSVNMDKFVVRFKSSEEALPQSWKTAPLPRSKPKRPVGRPRKRPLDSAEDNSSSAKRVCPSDPPSEPSVSPSEPSDSLGNMDNTVSPSAPSVNPRVPSVSPSDSTGNMDNTVSPSEPSVSPSVSPSEPSVSPSVSPSEPSVSPSEPSVSPSEPSVSPSEPSVSPSDSTVNPNTPGPSNIRGNYKHFTLKQKLKVQEFVKLHGIRTAAKHFKIPKSTVDTWSKTDFSSEVRDKKGALPRSGRPLTYPQELDMKILEYVLEERDLQNAVSVDDICRFAADVIKPVSPGFAASRRWAAAFMKRHDLSLRAKTSLSQRLPNDLEEKLVSFHEFVTARREEDEFDDNLIINMDETPVYFDLQPSKTIAVLRVSLFERREVRNDTSRWC